VGPRLIHSTIVSDSQHNSQQKRDNDSCPSSFDALPALRGDTDQGQTSEEIYAKSPEDGRAQFLWTCIADSPGRRGWKQPYKQKNETHGERKNWKTTLWGMDSLSLPKRNVILSTEILLAWLRSTQYSVPPQRLADSSSDALGCQPNVSEAQGSVRGIWPTTDCSALRQSCPRFTLPCKAVLRSLTVGLSNLHYGPFGSVYLWQSGA
jgi:hypothetical protein